MSENAETKGLRERLASGTEDALGKLAQDLLENPLIHGAISRAFEAREKASQAQEVAMGALNLPSATDIERLTRRLRSVSQRLEGIEDGVDRLDRSLSQLAGGQGQAAAAGADSRLGAVEEQLAALNRQVAELRESLPGSSSPLPRGQERLRVDDPPADPPNGGGSRRTARRSATKS
jgi:CRP-like cAMP-binding protein